MVNADTTKYSSIKLDYLFWILGISIISNAHQLFWIESLASYFEIQNRSMCFRLNQNDLSRFLKRIRG